MNTLNSVSPASSSKSASLLPLLESVEDASVNKSKRYPMRSNTSLRVSDEAARVMELPKTSSIDSLSRTLSYSMKHSNIPGQKSTSMDALPAKISFDATAPNPRSHIAVSSSRQSETDYSFSKQSDEDLDSDEKIRNVSRKYVYLRSKISNFEEKIMKEEDIRDSLLKIKETCEDEKDAAKVLKAVSKSEAKLNRLRQQYEAKKEEARMYEMKEDASFGQKGSFQNFYNGFRVAMSSLTPQLKKKEIEKEKHRAVKKVESPPTELNSIDSSPKSSSSSRLNIRRQGSSKHGRAFARALGFNRESRGEKEKHTSSCEVDNEDRVLLERLDDDTETFFANEEDSDSFAEDEDESNILEKVMTEVMLKLWDEHLARENLQKHFDVKFDSLLEGMNVAQSASTQAQQLAKENLILKSEIMNLLNLHSEAMERIADWEEWASKLEYQLRLSIAAADEGREAILSFNQRFNSVELKINQEISRMSFRKEVTAYFWKFVTLLLTAFSFLLVLLSKVPFLISKIISITHFFPLVDYCIRSLPSRDKTNEICFSLEKFAMEEPSDQKFTPNPQDLSHTQDLPSKTKTT